MSRSQPAYLKLLLQNPTATVDNGTFSVYDVDTANLIGSCGIDIPNIDSPGSIKDYTGDVVIEVEFALTSSYQLEYRYRITGLYYGTNN